MIPMVDLKRQHLHLKAQIEAAVNGVLEDTRFILRPNVAALEHEIAEYHKVPYAVGVANGTDAIRLALKACGIGAGDEVLTSPFTFISVAEVLLDVGATPAFVDISADTFTMNPERIDARMSTINLRCDPTGVIQ